jgi:hypothetical protein
LTASSQDQAPLPADEICIAVVGQGRAGQGRVYILRANAARKLGPIAACESIRKLSEDEFRRCFGRAKRRSSPAFRPP